MAQISKIKRTALAMYFNHCNRTEMDGIDRSNECIDNERTHLNYHFKEGGTQEYKKRLNDLYYSENRDDVITFASVVVTLPSDVQNDHPEDIDKFFESCYDFLCEKFGYDNVVNAVVHLDETTPHLHFGFIPAVGRYDKEISNAMEERIEDWENSRGRQALGFVDCKSVLNRELFKNFHPELFKYVEEKLGYKTQILNGATVGGNKTILEMKNKEVEKEIEKKQEFLKSIDTDINAISKQFDSLGIDRKYMNVADLLNKLSAIQEENQIYKNLLIENKIALPKEVAENVKGLRQNYRLGKIHTVSGEFQPTKKYIVVETYKNIERPLPLDDYISRNMTLINAIRRTKPKAILEESDFQNNYLIVPTDSIADTVEAMYYIKNLQDKYDSLSLCKFSNDPDDLVREILQKTDIDTEYFVEIGREENTEKQKEMVLT